jgi:hypothetical protein
MSNCAEAVVGQPLLAESFIDWVVWCPGWPKRGYEQLLRPQILSELLPPNFFPANCFPAAKARHTPTTRSSSEYHFGILSEIGSRMHCAHIVLPWMPWDELFRLRCRSPACTWPGRRADLFSIFFQSFFLSPIDEQLLMRKWYEHIPRNKRIMTQYLIYHCSSGFHIFHRNTWQALFWEACRWSQVTKKVRQTTFSTYHADIKQYLLMNKYKWESLLATSCGEPIFFLLHFWLSTCTTRRYWLLLK